MLTIVAITIAIHERDPQWVFGTMVSLAGFGLSDELRLVSKH
jgi:hypothetical protein